MLHERKYFNEKLKENLYYVGILNPNLRVFDIIMTADYGTSYNSYIVKGEKTALIETAHNKFITQFIDNINEVCSPSDIDYVIFNHTEPDHSGSLEHLLEINPDITVYATAPAIKNLKNITNREFKAVSVKSGDALDLGNGIVFDFISAPNLHWPDSMFTHCKALDAVFTCDFLGSHYCETAITDDIISYPDEYKSAFFNYYSAIFGPFKQAVRDGLKKLKELDFSMVCPSHGPVLKNMLSYCIGSYEKWSESDTETDCASVFYVSAYGYTEMMAKALCDGITEAGFKCECFDIIKHTQAELSEALSKSSAYLIGSPTINRDAVKPVWDLISCIDPVSCRGKQVLIFGSYGWSGEACANLTERVKGIGLKPFGEPFKSCFKPTDAELSELKNLGREFAAQVLKK